MKYTFRGGTHVNEHKNTAGYRTELLTNIKTVAIPLSQHIGAPCKPQVAVGDTVLRGQMIGDVEGGLGCPIHASVSGKVIAIESKQNTMGAMVQQIVIENDFQYTMVPDMASGKKEKNELSPEELVGIIRRAGIVGMGGATFPTYAKIQSALGKVNHVIINCAECEPYITVNHRLMLEEPERIVNGVKILLKLFGTTEAWIAVEDNKMDAVQTLEKIIGEDRSIQVKVMKTKYPQGDERQLIFALTGQEMPTGKLPADVGCVIFNAETCAAIYAAYAENMPLIERRVTVDGDCVQAPKNLLVPIGTPYMDLIQACGGLKKVPHRVISGGPMMGFAQWDLNAPVTKGTSAILILSEDAVPAKTEHFACIRCGRCVKNCPMHLMPNELAAYGQRGRYTDAEQLHIMSCVECGTCTYNCPGQVPIVQYIRVAKGAIRAAQAAARAQASAGTSEAKKGGRT